MLLADSHGQKQRERSNQGQGSLFEVVFSAFYKQFASLKLKYTNTCFPGAAGQKLKILKV